MHDDLECLELPADVVFLELATAAEQPVDYREHEGFPAQRVTPTQSEGLGKLVTVVGTLVGQAVVPQWVDHKGEQHEETM